MNAEIRPLYGLVCYDEGDQAPGWGSGSVPRLGDRVASAQTGALKAGSLSTSSHLRASNTPSFLSPTRPSS